MHTTWRPHRVEVFARAFFGALFWLVVLTPAVYAQSANGTAIVRHAPSVNGRVEGSIHQMLPEDSTFNGGAIVTRDLLVPGTPSVRLNGHPNYAGTLDGPGAATPTSFQVTLNGGATLRNVVRRIDAPALPALGAPGSPTGSATVTVNSAGESVNWSTVCNLTLNGGVGQFTVPAGSYGDFIANGGAGFTLGTAGATTPSVYDFQSLTLNGNCEFKVVGPVIVNVANGFSANGVLGSSGRSSWLTLNICSGSFTLNGGSALHGFVTAPGGTVTVNGNSLLIGGVIADRLVVNGNGILRLQSPTSPNQPPTVSLISPANGSVFSAPASFTLLATAADVDGSVAKVEFFQGTTKLGEDASAPYGFDVSGLATGTYGYFARVTDNDGAPADSAVVGITVSVPNQQPVVTFTGPADGSIFTAPATIALTATASDEDGAVAKVEFYQGESKVGEDTTDPYEFSVTGLGVGTYAFSVRAIDDLGAITTSVTTTATVVNPNQSPTVAVTAPADGTTFAAPGTFTLTATAADADGAITKVEFFRDGVLLGEDTTPPYSFDVSGLPIGSYNFLARATDNSSSATDSAPVTISVANFPPTAPGQDLATDEDTAIALTLTATDPNGDILTYDIVAGPSHGVLSGIAPNLTYTPHANFHGSDSFTFTAGDAALTSAAATVNLTINAVNDRPVATDKSVELAEDVSAAVALAGMDVETAVLNYTVVTAPAHGTLSGTGPDLTYTPAADYHGPDSFTYTVDDGMLISAAALVSINVTAVNDPPVVVSATVGVNEGATVAITVTANDPDGDALTYTVLSGPTHGTLSGTAPNLAYHPPANFNGLDSFTLQANDGHVDSAPGTITIQVSNLNDPPVANAQSATVIEDTPQDITLTGTDPDGDTLAYQIETAPAHGTLSGTAPNLTYTPSANHHGADSFSFYVTDGTLQSDPATVSLAITPVNDVPVATSETLTATPGAPLSIVLGGVDADGDPLTFTRTSEPAHGSITGVEPNLTYTRAADFPGFDSFTFTASDGTATSAPATITLAGPVNQPPMANAGPDAVAGYGAAGNQKPFSNILINHDEWTLTDQGFANSSYAAQFARNIADWFTGGRPGRFLAYTKTEPGHVEFAYTGAQLRAAMESAGHTWETSSTIEFTLENIRQYDAVFLCANQVDNQVLIDYVNGGGSVYISAGTNWGGQNSDVEASWYNPFLNTFGLAYGYPYNSIGGTLLVESSHPIFEGITALYYSYGNPVIVLDPNNPRTSVVSRYQGQNLFALYSRSAMAGTVMLHGAGSDDGLPSGNLTYKWTRIDGPDLVFFAEDAAADTEVTFFSPGVYTLQLTVSDGVASASDTVVITLEPNDGPMAFAGGNIGLRSTADVFVPAATMFDDGVPRNGTLTPTWRMLAGPAQAQFSDVHALRPTVAFPANGIYTLELSVTDGQLAATSIADVRVGLESPEPPAGLAAWWPGNDHGLEIVNGQHDFRFMSFADGRVSRAFDFAGVAVGSTPAHPDLDVGASAAGMSVEFWARPTEARSASIVHWANDTLQGFSIKEWDNGPNLIAWIIDTTGQERLLRADGFFTTGTWVHVAFTYDRTTGIARIYRNGTIFTEQNMGMFTIQTSYDFNIGGMRFGRNAFKGQVDEISIYRRPLTAAEVAGIHAAGSTGKGAPDNNQPPVVSAGPDRIIAGISSTASLAGTVTDDDKPFGPAVVAWSQITGPAGGETLFGDPTSAATTATFTVPGTYLLKLVGSDGYTTPMSDVMEVRVGATPAEPVSALAAWWPGNASPQEVVNGDHDVELINGAGYASGRVLQAFSFDGTNDFGKVPAHADLDIGSSVAGFTIEMWARPERGQNAALIAWANPAGGEIMSVRQWDNGSTLYAWTVNAAGTARLVGVAGFFATNTWVHVAVTYDRVTGQLKVYKNGILVQQEGIGSQAMMTSSDLFIGAASRTGALFQGQIDEVSLYRRPLTAAEVATVFQSGEAGKSVPDDNTAPAVDAGPDLVVLSTTSTATLNGVVADDNRPFGPPSALWSQVTGPAGGTADFGDRFAASTTATFDATGTYLLQLTGSDGATTPVTDYTEVRVGVSVPELAPSAAAWWPGNNSPNEIINGNHDVELVNGAGYAAGQVLRGFDFDGTNDFGKVPAHAHLDIGSSAAGFTIEMWARPTRGQNATLIAWSNPAGGEFMSVRQWDSGPTLYAWTVDTAGAARLVGLSGFFATNVWVHVAVTYDRVAGVVKLYKNGILVHQDTIGSYAMKTSSDVFIGAGSATGSYFQGQLDEISLYRQPLSAAEVAAIYQAGADGKSPPDDNQPPVVSAGPNVLLAGAGVANLAGSVTDDNKPFGPPGVIWSQVTGPAGAVADFADKFTAATTATFTVPGTYLLQLTASDGLALAASDVMEVRVAAPAAALPADAAAWWPGNASPEEIIHGNHDVELVNGAGYATGSVLQAFTFDGTNDFGRVPAHADLDIGSSAAGFTIEMWARPTRGQNAALIGWSNPAGGEVMSLRQWDSGPTLYAWTVDTAGTPRLIGVNGFFATNTWVHVAFTYDRVAGVGKLYKNGVKVGELAIGSFAMMTTGDLYLGAISRTGALFQGQIDEVSLYQRPLTAAEIAAIHQGGIDGKLPPVQNVPPAVLLDTPASGGALLANSPLTLSALATDSDGTVAKVEFYDGATKLGEVTAPDAGQPTRFSLTVPAGLVPGSHALTARATDDSGALTSSPVSTVNAVAELPVVALTVPVDGTSVAAGAPVTLRATATYGAAPITKVEFFDGATKLGEATAPISGNVYEFNLTGGFAAGPHGLRARVITADGVSASSATNTITASEVLPEISFVSPTDGVTVVAGAPVSLRASARIAAGSIAKVEFFDGATKLGERVAPDSSGGSLFTFTAASGFAAGTHSLTARATSAAGSITTSAAVGITAGSYTGAPVIELHAPDEDARISAPVTVTGVVALPALTGWSVQYRLKAADGAPEESWMELAAGPNLVGTPPAGSTPAVPGNLGTFDPTRLINGIYEIRLRATDASLTTHVAGPITVVVEGNMKVGAFTLAFEDLKVPVAGVPITVTRTYDSRDPRVGDFGPGWRLAVANVRVQKNRNLGANWFQTLQEGSGIQFYYVDPISQPVVTVTMPDGETHRFRGGAYVKNRAGDPDNASFAVVVQQGLYKFYPLGDTTATLEPIDAAGQLADQFYIHGTGEQDLRVEDASDPFSATYNPTRFRLTTKDGTRYLLDERLGLLRLEDLNGNTLVLNRDAQDRVTSIVSQQAAPAVGAPLPAASSVVIHRDATGRVDYIRDPANQDLDYLYDAAGRLEAFSNRELNITQFRYENPAFSHYLTKIIDPRGIAALRSEFDADGKLIKQIDADGKETVFARGIDATGRFEKVTDRLGKATTFYYDDRGNVTLKIDPLGAQTTFAYYPDSDRVKFETDHYGNVKSMAYDARGNVTVETVGASTSQDPANPTTGYTTRTTYNALSAPTQITDPDGRVQTFGYDPVTNNLLTHTIGAGGPAPATTTYHYNTDGTLDTVTDALGNVTSHAYNYSFSNAAYPGGVKQVTVTVTQAASLGAGVLRVTRTIYDAQENMLAQIATRTLPAGGTEDVITRYLYDAENRLSATIMPDGKVSETRYTSFGQTDKTLLWKSLADYQAGGTAAARVTSYGYDNRGNQTSTTYPDGTSESASFDLENRREWSQDKLGRTTYFQYDAVGRLRFTIFPDATPATNDNPYTETVYDLAGRVTDSYDELRNRTRVTYFPDGTPDGGRRKESIQVLASGDLVTSYQYDASGNVRFVTDPRGNTTETVYDDHGRPTTMKYPATDEHPATQSVTKYNVLGQRVETVDQEGKVMRYRFDGLGRLVQVRQYSDQSLAASDTGFTLASTATGVVVTRYTYDEMGNQLTQTDARGNMTSYRYDNLGRRTSRILPDNAAESLQYDEWGNLWKRTDFKGYTTTFGYDTLNRLTSKQADPSHPSLIYSHAPDRISYGYDAAGNRTDAMVEKGGSVQYAEDTPVDERGRRQFKDTAYGKLTYDYYANGLLKGINSSQVDGIRLGYRYDEANRLTFVDDTADGGTRTSGYTYNANGSLSTMTAANGVTHTYIYDTLNRLRVLNVAKGSSPVHNYEYKLKASGHRRQVIDNGSRTTTYTYDDLYRLTNEALTGDTRGNNGSVGYTLDKVGNRESRASSITAVANVTNTFNSRSWLSGDTYDANGNTTLSVGISLPDVYDFEDHLIIRHKPDGSTVNLSYDADGILRQKTVFNASSVLVSATGYLTDTLNPTGYAQILEERINAAAGTTVKLYAYGSDLISQSTLAPGATLAALRYYSYDGLGSVRELTNESGAVTDAFDYDAFGILIYRSGTTDNSYLYRGEQFDADLGMYSLRARFYNQNTGRFWNQDTYEGSAGDPASLHKYLYAHANPVMGLDPSGHSTLSDLNMTQGAMGNLFKMANVTLRIMRTVDKATTALDAVSLVRDLSLFFMNPAGSGLGHALNTLKSAFGIDHTFARFFTVDGIREAFETLATNTGKIILETAERGLVADMSKILARPNSSVVLYMPTPVPNLHIGIPPLKTGIKFRGRDVTLYFGKSAGPSSINAVTGGRVFGLGVTDPTRPMPFQIFRMDWHEKHYKELPAPLIGPPAPAYDWDSGDYHFHMGKSGT